jgi:transcriptional regulator with XRE-family HTH domain
MSAAEIVLAMRTRMAKSQADFGKLLGCSQVSVSRYESGESEPTLGILLRLYDVGLSVERGVIEHYIKKGLGGKYINQAATVDQLRGLIEDSAIEEQILRNVPERLREKWEPLVDVIARLIRTDRAPDESITTLIRLWEANKDYRMEGLLRDAVGYIRVQVSRG